MTKLTDDQQAELRALAEMSEEEIDFSDIPNRPVDWSTAQRGTMYQPIKQRTNLTLDEYVIDWFEENEPDETARHEAINQILLEYIMRKRFPSWGKIPGPVAQEPRT